MKIRPACRLCGSRDLATVLELKPTPPANEFVKADAPEQERFPLYLARCSDCGHVQLPAVVDPERLFGNYVYVSGTSPALVQHFQRYADWAAGEFGLKEQHLVVDVGSNDGTLLRAFKERCGSRVLGVDPARDIAAAATQSGVTTLPLFFNREVASLIRDSHGPAALVTANNVFAHADNLSEIALAARDLLDPKWGRFVFEVQYVVDMVEQTLFDMVYHEHLSYHSLGPLQRFFAALGMTLVDAERVTTHGGSIRCTVFPYAAAGETRRLQGMLAAERDLTIDRFSTMASRIHFARHRLRGWFDENDWGVIAGFGAPAKLTTLCHQFGITSKDIAYVVDDSTWKQGLFTPGTRIPVVPASHLETDPPDKIVIFAWNYAEQIAAKLPQFKGRLVVPLPEFKEL